MNELAAKAIMESRRQRAAQHRLANQAAAKGDRPTPTMLHRLMMDRIGRRMRRRSGRGRPVSITNVRGGAAA